MKTMEFKIFVISEGFLLYYDSLKDQDDLVYADLKAVANKINQIKKERKIDLATISSSVGMSIIFDTRAQTAISLKIKETEELCKYLNIQSSLLEN